MQEITKELLEDLYYNQGLSYREIVARLDISRKKLIRLMSKYDLVKPIEEVMTNRKKKWQKKYGVDHTSKLPEIKQKIVDSGNVTRLNGEYKEKYKKTCLEKYGVENYSLTEEYREKCKQTCLEKYGVEHPHKIAAIRDKRYKTLQEHHSWNASKPEEKAYELLLQHFSEDDIIRQYKSEAYPYLCDFYIKSIDTYLEYQGNWTHGHCPYEPTNPIHQKLVQKWKTKDTKYYNYAIDKWTRHDPEKRKTAKENKLNFVEVFSIDELKDWLKQF